MLGSFSTGAAPGIGQPWSREAEFGFSLTCPVSGSGISVHAVFTDAESPDNTTDALTLTGANIPQGVAVKLFQENGTPITFGRESVDPGAPGRFDLFTAPPEGVTNQAVSFRARLYQTGPTLSEGPFNATALVTLSYD